MSWRAAAWALLAAGLWASNASAVGLDVATNRVDGSGEITLTIGLTESALITGYELFLGWDPEELSFAAATPIWAGGFTLAPTADGWESSRVARLSLALLDATSLFSLTFASSPLAAFDGEADFYVTASGRGGVASAAGMGLLDLFPTGVGFDLGPSGFAPAAVPLPPPPPKAPVIEEELPELIAENDRILEATALDWAGYARPTYQVNLAAIADNEQYRLGYGRPDFVWSTTTSFTVPEPRLPVLGLAALLAMAAWKRLRT